MDFTDKLMVGKMRDKTHMEQVEKWAEFCRDNPRSVWIKQTKPLVDLQTIMANRFYKRLARIRGGKEKIKALLAKA